MEILGGLGMLKKKIFNKLIIMTFLVLFINGLSFASEKMIPFKTLDINEEEVDGGVFQRADLTMINIWATFCPPCLDELPALGKISKEYEDKNFQIIGIVADVRGKENLDLAKEIIEKTEADFLHILPSQDLIALKLKNVSVVPETIFVDKNGNVVGQSIVGSRNEVQWKSIIDQYIEEYVVK